jgi:hypothetical protein
LIAYLPQTASPYTPSNPADNLFLTVSLLVGTLLFLTVLQYAVRIALKMKTGLGFGKGG